MARHAGHMVLRPPPGEAAHTIRILCAASVLDRRRAAVLAAAALVAWTLTPTRLFSSAPSSSLSHPSSSSQVAATRQAPGPAVDPAAAAAAAWKAMERRKPRRTFERRNCCSCRPAPFGSGSGVLSHAGNSVRLFSLTRNAWAHPRLRRQSLLVTLSPNLRVIRSPDTSAAKEQKSPPEGQPREKAGTAFVSCRAERHRKGTCEAEPLAEVSSGDADPAVAPRKDLWARVKDGAKHYWDGTRLLVFEIKISAKLLHKLTKGDKLTRREHRQLKRTTADMIRLVPFLVFVIVPFLEFLLPVFLKLFPNMLPSTFEDKDLADAEKKKLVKVRLDVAQFLQETIGEISFRGNSSSAKAGKELAEFFRKIRIAGELASAEDISNISARFEDGIMLENLSRPQLVSICRYSNMNAFGTDNFLRFQIRKKMQKLKADDKMIQAEGVDSLTVAELQQACTSRGIQIVCLSPACLREELQLWLDLHLKHQVPSVVLMLSRALGHAEQR